MSNHLSTQSSDAIEASLQSAKLIAPFVFDILKPKSVIDFGCGLGTWLLAFKQLGVKRIKGIDSQYINQKKLMIDIDEFEVYDLNLPYKTKEKFELAISLEVAEHLLPSSAEVFIESLTQSSDIVLFSAATPNKDVNPLHINEQKQSFWEAIFLKNNFIRVDCIRPYFWDNDKIKYWYRQNSFLYIHHNILSSSVVFNKLHQDNQNNPTDIIHPEMFEVKGLEIEKLKANIQYLKETPLGLKEAFRNLIKAIIIKFKKWIK
jgi:SAM-dependent methyltransferase